MRDPTQDWIIHRRAAELIPQDTNIQTECRQIWNDLTPQEQDALMSLFRGPAKKEPPGLDSVIAQHLVISQGPERRIFARAFAEFVQRQHVARRPGCAGGLRVDSGQRRGLGGRHAGARPSPISNIGCCSCSTAGSAKSCTKYDVVEAVWGEDYIDEVDDARIEKLVSRLRQKIEPDIANPRYVITVAGPGL